MGQRLLIIGDALHYVVLLQLLQQFLLFISVDQLAHRVHDLAYSLFARGHLIIAFYHQRQLLGLDLLDFLGRQFLFLLELDQAIALLVLVLLDHLSCSEPRLFLFYFIILLLVDDFLLQRQNLVLLRSDKLGSLLLLLVQGVFEHLLAYFLLLEHLLLHLFLLLLLLLHFHLGLSEHQVINLFHLLLFLLTHFLLQLDLLVKDDFDLALLLNEF